MRKVTVDVGGKYGEEYKGKYVLRELSWAKKSRIAESYMRINPQTGLQGKTDYVAIEAETLWVALMTQPESRPLSLAKLLDEENGVPEGLFKLLQKASNSINGLDIEEVRFLLMQLSEEDRTLLLQSFDSAKSSDAYPTPSDAKRLEESSNSF